MLMIPATMSCARFIRLPDNNAPLAVEGGYFFSAATSPRVVTMLQTKWCLRAVFRGSQLQHCK